MIGWALFFLCIFFIIAIALQGAMDEEERDRRERNRRR